MTTSRTNALVLCLMVIGLTRPSVRNFADSSDSHPQETSINSQPQVDPPGATAEADRLNNIGVGYMNQQQFEKALVFFRSACAKNSKSNIARLNEGIALLNAQQVDAAEKILMEITRDDVGSPRAWYNLGLLYKSQGKAESALRAFAEVTKRDPKDADTQYFLGSLYLQLKQFSKAIASFQQALQLNPYHASAQFGLARAYQQSGDSQNARQHLARFQQVTASKLGVPMSVAYGEQGPYSLAETSSGTVEPVLPEIPVHFVEATAEVGLPTAIRIEKNQQGTNTFSLVSSGACFFDYDNDGRPDLLLTAAGPKRGVALYHNVGNGHFQDVTISLGLDPTTSAIGCAAGDYDNDGFTDLAVSYESGVVLYHNEKGSKLRDVTHTSGIRTSGPVLGMSFVDYDHDGDLDLYVARGTDSHAVASRGLAHTGSENNVLWRNNGNGTFTDVTDTTDLSGQPSTGIAVTDFNNDRAVDLVVTGGLRSPTIYVNPREDKFQRLQPWSENVGPTTGIAVLDFDKDGWMDLAFTLASAPGVSLWRNIEGSRFDQVPLPKLNWVRGWGVTALDYDNDGWIDLAVVGETADGHGEVRLFRNMGPAGFKDVTADVGLDKIALHEPRALIAGDYDGDGATDVLITQNQGPPVLLRNIGGNRNHWMRLSLKGLNDNKSAIGTKVEVFAGAIHQKWEIQGGAGFLGQNSLDINVGLGEELKADLVRLLWPTGVVQDEVEMAAGRKQEITEIDRRGSSCPTLFAWDGHQFRFVADMLGAGVVGHWIAPGQRNIPRPIEYLKVQGNQVKPRDGKLSFRFMEPMEEVVYLDQVRLLAVDHPQEVEVFPNESFLSSPPYPDFEVIVSRDARPPAGAWDGHGRDVLPELLSKDRQYVTGFKQLPFAGLAEPHRLELDLGQRYEGGALRLLMHGYVDYFTANSMYAAAQAGITPIAPYVEALSPSGKWLRVIEDMGFPAGLPRTMVTDLSGRLPLGTQRIRLTTNLQIYWDQILIDRTSKGIPVRITPARSSAARLDFHGYPRQISRSLPGDIDFLYHDASATGPYAREAGNYTRYGDVLRLVSELDDQFVVFGSGEEVALEFDSASLPHLPAGWTRDYFFMAEGYEKDMDFYAAEANTVQQLPYHAMPSYPYGSEHGFPDDDQHLNYLLNYNTREVSGKEPRSYQFEFSRGQIKATK